MQAIEHSGPSGFVCTFRSDHLIKSANGFRPVYIGVFSKQDSNRLLTFEKKEDSLQVIASAQFSGKLTKEQWLFLGDKTLLYLEYTEPKDTKLRGSIFFSLFDPKQKTFTTLAYQYESGKHARGKFVVSKELDTLGDQLKALKRMALSRGILSSDVALRGWAMLNEGVFSAMEENQPNLRLNFQEYPGDLSDIIMNNYKSDSADVVIKENSNFKITLIEGSPVVVYNKLTTRSYVVWAPTDSSNSVGEAILRGAMLTLITSKSGGNKKIEIDLNSRAVRLTKSVQKPAKRKKR